MSAYPSLDREASGATTKEAMLNTNIVFNGVNYKAALHYLALILSDTQIYLSGLRRVIPRRSKKKGTKPTITGPQAGEGH